MVFLPFVEVAYIIFANFFKVSNNMFKTLVFPQILQAKILLNVNESPFISTTFQRKWSHLIHEMMLVSAIKNR